MCGVLTLVSPKKSRDEAIGLSEAMLEPLRQSRGPDAWGCQLVNGNEYKGQVVFGHARLSIIDLSAQSNQPMVDPETGLSLTYNGEIYNYRELREQLAGRHSFLTQSDSEVLLAALKVWGLTETLKKLRGMFAFVAYDPKTSTLMAARDRAGEKPLSYGQVAGDWVFTSDLRVLNLHPDWQRQISLARLKTFFRYRFVPHPQSIFKGFNKLGPGQYLIMNLNSDSVPSVVSYWNIVETWALEKFSEVDDRGTIEKTVVRTLRASDTPVGCFLSGGIDSSLVTALAAMSSEQPVNAYTIQFTDSEFDESDQAKKVAQSLGVNHTVVPFGFSEFRQSFDELNHFLDEPCAVHSFYPLGYLARRAKQDVKVCLSGDGGDELFAGYNRYIFWYRYMRTLMDWPDFIRQPMVSVLQSSVGDQVLRSALKFLGERQSSQKVKKVVQALKACNMSDYYQNLIGQERSPMGEGGEFNLDLEDWDALHRVERLMTMDFSFYLPCDVLNKVDRATMACGLEARAPLLDLDVIEMAGHLPIDSKIDSRGGKANLRRWLAELIPEVDFNQAKSGFTTPISKWRNQLFDKNFFEKLRESQVYQLMDQDYINRLEKGQFEGEEGFTLYCMLFWFENHKLSFTD